MNGLVIAVPALVAGSYTRGCNRDCSAATSDLDDSNLSERFYFATNECPTHTTPFCGVSTWDVSRVTTLDSVLRVQYIGYENDTQWTGSIEYDTFNEDLGAWNTAQVTSLKDAFHELKGFNQDINGWNTANVVTLEGAFAFQLGYGAAAFGGQFTDWNTAKVTTTKNMFQYDARIPPYNFDLSKWDTGQLTSVEGMFRVTERNQYGDLNKWDVSKVTNFDRFIYARLDGLDTSVDSWNVASLTSIANFGPLAFSYDNYGDPQYTMDLTSWTVNPGTTYNFSNFGDCRTFVPPPVGLIGEICGTTSTTTTATTITSATTTTAVQCGAGTRRNVAGNACEACPDGQYRTAVENHTVEDLTSCRPHSACGPGEVTLFSGNTRMDAQCVVPSATSHCGTDEFNSGGISEYQGTWHLQCIAHSDISSLSVTECPWTNSSHTNVSNTLASVEVLDGSVHDPDAPSTAQEELFQSIDELIRAENDKGHVWVRLCTPKKICLEADNEYVASNGSESTNRECRVCPRICGGIAYAQPTGCDNTDVPVNTLLPRTECTKPVGNNSAICCRIGYDRDAYQQNLTDGDCTHNPFGDTNATANHLNHQCNGVVALRSILSTTTTTSSTTSITDSSFTTSTTHLHACNPGSFRNAATNLCTDCPDGQFQRFGSFTGTSCQPHSVCDNETEVQLTAVDVIDARKHDTLCGTVAECPNGQYRVNYNDGTVQSGSWQLDCRAFEAVVGAGACDQTAATGLNITILQNDTAGGLVVQHDFEALRNLPLVHICSFWTDCVASENQYIVSDASTSSDRVCQQCPYLESNTGVQSGWTQHSCNMREAADGSYTTAAGYHGECTGVTRDNAHYCCRRGYDRNALHFREATAEDCRMHALNEDDVGISHGWLANSILVPNPTTTTTTSVTESKVTTTSTTPPETIDVSGDTVRIVAAGTSSNEEEAAGFAALGIGVAVIIGVCVAGIYQARKSSFSDRALFEKEKTKLMLFHQE